MSHFSVLVVTPEKPTREDLAKIMQPYHEFECTGMNDEYVQNIDKMQEARDEYESSECTKLKDASGKLFDPWNDQFYRDPTPEERGKVGGGTGFGNGLSWTSRDWKDGKGYRAKVRFVPDGFEEVSLKRKDIVSFVQFVAEYYDYAMLAEKEQPDLKEKHKYGWYRVNTAGEVIEIIRRTNPNKKWDWWEIGGRWSGMIKLKADAKEAPTRGKHGLFGSCRDPEGYDSARKDDIDFDTMEKKAELKARAEYRRIMAVIEPHIDGFQTWDNVRDNICKGDIGKARDFYNMQFLIKALRDAEMDSFHINPEDFLVEEVEYVARAISKAFCTFAFLRDGKWAQRGEMGWWACVSNEKQDWEQQFADLLAEVPGDHWLTIVDCHI